VGYVDVLLSLLILASLDSINPCAISITATITLIASSLGFGGLRVLKMPLLFIVGVYLGYFVIGFMASWVLGLSRVLLALILVLAMILIALDLREALSRRALMCKVGECLPSWLNIFSKQFSSFILVIFGVIVSWSFMMCSAAPYIIFLGILSSKVEFLVLRVVFIALYCLIIVTPLILVALAPLIVYEKLSISYRNLLLLRSMLLTIIVLLGVYYLYLGL